MARWSSGEWRTDGSSIFARNPATGRDDLIAVMLFGHPCYQLPREANARLIVLAPELYGMLSKLQSQFGRYWPEEYNAQVSRLLAKAYEEETGGDD